MRVAPDSKVNFCHLDEREQQERHAALKFNRMSIRQVFQRAIAKLAKQELKLKLNARTLKHAKQAMKDLATKKEVQQGLEDAIYIAMKEFERKGKCTKGEPITREMCKPLVDEFINHARNWVHTKRGKHTAVSYNPGVLGAAMNQYLRSPAAYRQWRRDSEIVQPSESYLKSLKSQQQVADGFCVETIVPQPTYRGSCMWIEWGHVGCDEIHITNGVAVNVKNNEVAGLCKDFHDITKIMKNLLDDDEIDNMEEPAVHAHQFCYRSTAGRIFNVMFFFNAGSLPGSVALEQLALVIHSCELVGCRVMGFICDAAGQMQTLLRYLRKKQKLPEVGWLPEDLVRFPNPYDTSRWVYVYHCMTHNLKNMRTQLWGSKPDGPKLFLDEDGNHIGKGIFEDAWLRDKERADQNALRETDVRQAAIELDKWSKMCAKWAKAPFSIITLTDILKHLYLLLGVHRDLMYPVDDHPTGYIGYFSTAAKKSKVIASERNPGSMIGSQVSSFEFSARVSELYNQCVLNMRQLITWENIDKIETQVKTNLEYVASLRCAQLVRKRADLDI